MNPIKTDETLFEKLHNEWIATLLGLEEHIQSIDIICSQLQSSVNDFQFQKELKEIRNEIILHKGLVLFLSEEVLNLKKKFSSRDENDKLTLSDLIENNKLREKIRKAEQSVFMLKYQINNFLSIAS